VAGPQFPVGLGSKTWHVVSTGARCFSHYERRLWDHPRQLFRDEGCLAIGIGWLCMAGADLPRGLRETAATAVSSPEEVIPLRRGRTGASRCGGAALKAVEPDDAACSCDRRGAVPDLNPTGRLWSGDGRQELYTTGESNLRVEANGLCVLAMGETPRKVA
jgi:hypothetical protein